MARNAYSPAPAKRYVMGHNGLRGDTVAHYEAIIEKNRERLHALSRIAAKSPSAEYYLPIRPRRLTVTLMNGFRRAAGREGDGDYRAVVASAVHAALANPSDEFAVRLVSEAIAGARRTIGLLDAARRGTDPDPELTDAEHEQVERLLREWLYVALTEFAPDEVA